jgi:hypothetical protein
MLLIDDVLLAPFRGLVFVCKEIARTAQEQRVDDEALRQDLREAYMLLETGRISQEEFERREHLLVGRLEAIERMKQAGTTR